MPIRASEKARYPKDWKAIRQRILTRANGRCECEGECGLHRTHPGPRRCLERDGWYATWAKGYVVLTIAHLNHTPEDNRPENLKAMCQRCHNADSQPAHRWRDVFGHWQRWPKHRLLWTSCCKRRRPVKNLRVKAYYDTIHVFCAPTKGCKR